MDQELEQAFQEISLGAGNKAYQTIARMDPEYATFLKGLFVDGTFGRKGALDRKTKELIMVGITCALGSKIGIPIHIRRALESGASQQEVLEAVEVSAIPGGMPGLWMGVEALQEILEEA